MSKAGMYALYGSVAVERITVVDARLAYTEALTTNLKVAALRRRRLLALVNAKKVVP